MLHLFFIVFIYLTAYYGVIALWGCLSTKVKVNLVLSVLIIPPFLIAVGLYVWLLIHFYVRASRG